MKVIKDFSVDAVFMVRDGAGELLMQGGMDMVSTQTLYHIIEDIAKVLEVDDNAG